ncbi:hypothetical protein PIB30_005659 [Stylosanthes scabra]|uniref:Uncharacterized protein n=1 Tax=Stylosanthes scabra TaxID=79078 RepID=A0ABU6T4U0_9FABA|nr:hypothetical protein [Stylosanthes scabra]
MSSSNPSKIILQSPSPNILVMSHEKKSNNTNKKKKLNMFLVHDDEEHLTRQISSNEGYYHDGGESASVPFVWESQPGTPKVIRFRETSLPPPLTPPPSYYQNATATPKKPTFVNNAKNKSPSKSSLLKAMLLFPKKRVSRNNNNKGGVVVPPSPESPNSWSHSSSSSSSSWRPTSYSVPNSPMVHPRKNGHLTTQDEDLYDVNDSNLCFGNARSRGCYSSMFKKKSNRTRCSPSDVARVIQRLGDKQKECVHEMRFGALEHLSITNMSKQVMMELVDSFNTKDNTMSTTLGTIKLDSTKVAHALGLNGTGDFFDKKIDNKTLNDEQKAAVKSFKGATSKKLKKIVLETIPNTEENKRKFKKAFILYVQKIFLCANSTMPLSPKIFHRLLMLTIQDK